MDASSVLIEALETAGRQEQRLAAQRELEATQVRILRRAEPRA